MSSPLQTLLVDNDQENAYRVVMGQSGGQKLHGLDFNG
jgi:hypothetical protein